MNIYVVYEKKTGQIVHTTAYYVLGNDEPIAWPEEDILNLTRMEVGTDADLGVARVPDDYDVRDRTLRLEIDVERGLCHSRKIGKQSPQKTREQAKVK